MNRLNVLLLCSFALIVSLAVGRLAVPAVSARPLPPKPVDLLEARSVPASQPVKIATAPTKAAAAPTTVPVPAPTKKIADGETPDDYVYVPPAVAKPKGEEPRVRTVAAPVAPARSGAASAPSPARTPLPGATTTASSYERNVADAVMLSNQDLDRAARRLERITAEQPARPEAYETLAAIRLRQGDFYQAYVMFDAALRNGGKATFSIVHDHSRGNFGRDPQETCVGELTLRPSEVTFDGEDGHHFAVSWAELLEAGPNRFFGSRIGGFHVKVTDAGRSRNFNLAPSSRDEREARILFDLLTANIQRLDSGR